MALSAYFPSTVQRPASLTRAWIAGDGSLTLHHLDEHTVAQSQAAGGRVRAAARRAAASRAGGRPPAQARGGLTTPSLPWMTAPGRPQGLA